MIPFLCTQREAFEASRLFETAATKVTRLLMEKMKDFKYDMIGS